MIRKIFIVIVALIVFLLVFSRSFGTEPNSHVSRGKMLKQLSQYDNNKVYRDFVKTRRSRSFNTVGFSPFITILPAGASLSASAVISADRRYVRIGVSPFFSFIGEVNTFNFGRR